MEVGAARFEQRPERGEELPEQADGPLVRDAEPGLGQMPGAEGEPEVVPAAGRRLGGLRLTGDEQGMAAEDGDRGGADLQARYLAPDDRGERGRVVREGLAEPRRVQAGVTGLTGEFHRGVDRALDGGRTECHSDSHASGNRPAREGNSPRV